MNEDQDRLWKIFHPESARQTLRVRSTGQRFAHYTSAEAGMAILGSNKMLLRNSTLMNDFSEVQHGINCLSRAYDGASGSRLKKLLKVVQDDLPDILEANFNSEVLDYRGETYITSISEHGNGSEPNDVEDSFGRLSMWRAYANKNGIAFVFNNDPFVTESNALNAFTSPVVYATIEGFHVYFDEVVDNIEKNIDYLVQLGGRSIHDVLLTAFRFAVQSTKHPAFSEEKEWRIIHSPSLLARSGYLTDDQLARVPTEIKVLNGVPQRVFALPFQNYPDEGFVGATIPELIDHILIGPSADAYAISQAFVAELTRNGVPDAHTKVRVTGVPLRV